MIENKRILIFNWRDTKHRYSGGAEVYILEMAKRWVKAGHKVTLFCGDDKHSPRYETIDGVKVIRRGGFYLVYVWAFLYYIFKFRGQFDVILDCQNGIPFFTPLYAKEKIFSIMFHVHQKVFYESLPTPLAMLASFLEEQVMPFVYKKTEFITISKSSAEGILQLGLGGEGLHVVTPGVDVAFMTPGVKSKSPLILYLGRLKRYKRVDIFLKMIPEILKQYPTARFVVAGDGEERARLQHLSRRLGIVKAVEFTGKVSAERKRELYQQAWVFVNPSITEGWSITNIEASACSTPVVASDVVGIQDSVKKNVTGFLVEYNSVSAFVKGVIGLLQSPELRKKMGEESVAWAQKFDWHTSAVQGAKVLQNSSSTLRNAWGFLRKSWFATLILSVLSLGIFTYQLEKESFWLDEIYTLQASNNWEALVATISWKEKNMWLYHLFMFFWQHLPTNEFIIRFPSVMFAVAGVVAMYFLGKDYKNRTVGWVSAIGLLINTTYIAYAQEARSYSLMILLFILSTLCFQRLLKKESRSSILTYTLVTGIAFYSHVFSLLFITIQLLVLFVFYVRKDRNLVSFLKIVGGIGLCILPLMFFYGATNNTQLLSHSQQALNWIPRPTLDSIYNHFFHYASLSITIFTIYIALLVYLLSSVFRRSLSNAYFVAYLYIIAFGTVACVLIFSVFVQPIYVPRYVIYALPAFILLVAIALSNIKNKRVFHLLSIIIVLFSLKNIYTYSLEYHKEQWRSVVAFVNTHIHNNEKVIVTPAYLLLPFSYYTAPTRAQSSSTITRAKTVQFNDFSNQQLNVDPQQVQAQLQGTRGVWLITRKENLPKQRAVETEKLEKVLAGYYKCSPTIFDYKLLVIFHYEAH